MRTDSTSIAEDAKKMILSYIKETFDTPTTTYAKYRTYKTKIANAQEAHEAVRITNPKHAGISFEGVTKNHEKLYELIWKRTLASLMTDAIYSDVCLKFASKNVCDTDLYYATKPFLKELGFQIVYKENETVDDLDNVDDFLSILKKNMMTAISKEYSSQGTIDDIPSLYNEVQLIKELEKEGIGRPSTYASIIDKLLEKKYVEIGTNPQQEYEIECFKKKKSGLVMTTKKINLGGKQKDLLVPMELGLDVIKYIYELFPYLCDLKFTSKMEDELDKIINASITKEDILNDLFAKIKLSIADVPDVGSGSCGSCGNREVAKEKKTGILTTRYGICYYNKDTDKYTNIEPYLKWKQITKEALTERDIVFISSLPKPVVYLGKKYNLLLGKYGIYLKDNKNNNHKLDKKLWGDFY